MINNNQNVFDANQVGVVNGEVQPKSAMEENQTNNTNNQESKAEELFRKGFSKHAFRLYEQAADYYKEAAALGCTDALYFLALLYYEGKGVEKDLVMSAKCFETVANGGGSLSEEAKLRLERLADIDSGKGIGIVGTDLDVVIAEGTEQGYCDVELYRKMWVLADQGDLEAQRLVAKTIFCYMRDRSTPDGDGETLMRYLRNLAEHGDTSAMTMLGEALANPNIAGVGIGDVDCEESLKWYRKAAQAGDTIALMELPILLDCGEVFKQDTDEAFFWQMHFIEEGQMVSKNDLEYMGYPYTNGRGKRWTKKKAFELYTKYAEQGDAIAQENLAYFYLNGVCVKKNMVEAFKWFAKAAEQGRETAQKMLVEVKERVGSLVREGRSWYVKSAKDGCVRKRKVMELREVSEDVLMDKAGQTKDGKYGLLRHGNIHYVILGNVVYYKHIKTYNRWVWEYTEYVLLHNNAAERAARLDFESYVEQLAKERYKELYLENVAFEDYCMHNNYVVEPQLTKLAS